LKVISSNQTRYKPSWKDRGVDKRAAQLHEEYVGKARNADQQHGGTQPGQIGRVEAKLLSFPKVEGIVFGVKLVRQPTSLWMLWPLAEQEWLSLRPAGGGTD
jgi:hypothetical protein